MSYRKGNIMKKILFIFCAFLLTACTSPLYRNYVGDKYVIGQGGFAQEYYSSEDLWLSKKYPDTGVGFWLSGLPEGQKCKLIGFAQDSDKERLAKEILENGGNIATQSSVSFPVSFEKNEGVLDVSTNGGNVTVHRFGNWGASSTTYYGYNVFHCE